MKDRLQTAHAQMYQAESHAQNEYGDEDTAKADPKPLTRSEVDALRKKLGGMSLQAFSVKVLVWQVLAAVTVFVLIWLVSSNLLVGYSALYGAMCVVLPSALVVRVVSRRSGADRAQRNLLGPVGLLVLETVKVGVTIALLCAAPFVLSSPDWVAVVAGFVVTLKMYWVVAFLGLRQAKQIKKWE